MNKIKNLEEKYFIYFDDLRYTIDNNLVTLNNFVTNPNHRRKGIFTSFLKELIEICRTDERNLRVEIHKSNCHPQKETIKYLISQGFIEVDKLLYEYKF